MGVLKAEVTYQPLGQGRGLEAEVVSSLLVDQQGFLWVGSREGVFRYDGYSATHFNPDIHDPNAISDTDIRNLYEDKDGNIWVSTNTAGLNYYDPKAKQFIIYRHEAENEQTISNDSVYDIVQMDDGSYWVGTDIGLNKLDISSGTFERHYFNKNDPSTISNDYIYNLLIDRDDNLWITTVGGGINVKEKGSNTFIRHSLSDLTGDPFNDEVFAIKQATDGDFWLGTRRGLIKYNPHKREAKLVGLREGEQHPAIVSLEVTGRGELLIGTISRGILRYDAELNRYQAFNTNPLGSKGQLPSLPVLAMEYYKGKLFVGTWGSGVYVARLGQLPFRVLGSGDDPRTGLSNHNATALYADNNHLLVGTFGGGAQKLNVATGYIEEQLASNEIFSAEGILTIVKHNEWIYAGASTGLWQIKGGVGKYYQYGIDDEHGIGKGYINSLVATDEGIWIGTGTDGLYWKKHTQEQFKSYSHEVDKPNSLSGYYITTILQTDDNTLWVGTRSSGLNRCQISPWKCEYFGRHNKEQHGLLSDNITHLYQDHDGDIWVATNGGGAYQLIDKNKVRFRAWGERNGLTTNVIMSIQQDTNGLYWLASREGISQLNTETQQVRNFKAESGLLITHFNRTTASQNDQYLFFGGIGGVLAIPKGTPLVPAPAPTVKVTRVETLGGDTDGNARGELLSNMVERKEIDYGDVFSVEFTVLDYSEKPHNYKYRMNTEEDWIELGGRREVTFYNLAPGSYQLQVMGQDVFGVWGETEPLELEVVPPFWMQTWFKLLVLAFVATFIIGMHRIRLNKLRARNRELLALQVQKEQALQDIREKEKELKIAFKGLRNLTNRIETAKEEERQHISRELHDELGQTLTATKINLQVIGTLQEPQAIKERLEQSISVVDGMIEQVRNVSLSLRPPLLDEAGLVPALEYYLDVIQERTGLDIQLEADQDVSGNSHDVRVVIFRIIQEAISNVLRHANATVLHIKLSVDGEQVCVHIEDDGDGYDIEAVNERIKHGEHLGLLGMLERVKNVNGHIELESEPGKGSTIKARIPR
ncbi:ligand-binding sensor domain-containing protein [Kangiella geojedonensis]|nr:sensor histidine kinase [Kangiella geojedonensis]